MWSYKYANGKRNVHQAVLMVDQGTNHARTQWPRLWLSSGPDISLDLGPDSRLSLGPLHGPYVLGYVQVRQTQEHRNTTFLCRTDSIRSEVITRAGGQSATTYGISHRESGIIYRKFWIIYRNRSNYTIITVKFVVLAEFCGRLLVHFDGRLPPAGLLNPHWPTGRAGIKNGVGHQP